MTRDEEMKIASKKYLEDLAEARISGKPKDVGYPPLRWFKAGVEWADEHPVNHWHDLRKDPYDLPPTHPNLSDRVVVRLGYELTVAVYNKEWKHWGIFMFESVTPATKEVEAWCEIPKFEEEES